MSEKSMWGRVRRGIVQLDPVRVENKVGPGTPDVNLANGAWVELKWVRRAPKKQGIVFIEHYTPEQRCWHLKRRQAGGKVFILLKIGVEWLIFNSDVAEKYLNKVNLEKLREVAIKTWKIKLNNEELKKVLTEN